MLVAVSVWRPRLIYEYPYFMGVVFAAFILPQAYGLELNNADAGYLNDTFLMCLLCLGACWLGYLPRGHPGMVAKLNGPIDPDRFLHGGIALVIVGGYFTYAFGAMDADPSMGLMTGIGTIYLFFGGLVYPGFAICFYCALKYKSSFAYMWSGISALIPIQAAVFYGRREPTVLFIFTLGMTLFFIKGIKPPRTLVAVLVAAAALVIPATGQYRQLAAEDPLEALRQTDFVGEFKNYFDANAISEVKNAMILIAATEESGRYGLGTAYWNRLIFRFVPAQFVGKEVKSGLMIGGEERDWADFVTESISFEMPSGSTVTGIGDSFNQFGFLGCLFFAAMAYLFKSLWAAANRADGMIAQILYIQTATSAMRALTHQTIDFLPGFIYSAIFVGLIALYARERVDPLAISISALSRHNSSSK